MSLSKKKDSPYYFTRFTVRGVRVQESTRTTVRSEAQQYEEKRKREVRQQLLLGNKPSRSWSEAKVRWLQEMQHKRSICDDISHFDWLQPHLGYLKLDEIKNDVIQKITLIKQQSGVKVATVNRTLALVRAVLNKACKQWEWIEKTPVIQLRKEDNSRVRWITREEAARLLLELPPHLREQAKFSLATGLRSKNVRYFKWSYIDMEKRHARIPADQMKNKKSLGVPLNSDALEAIRNQIGKDNTYVFPYEGKPTTQCSTKAWRKALARAGIKDFRWHDLRHTWASWHVQAGTTLQELFELGGWSSFDMVLRYAHLASNHLQEAAQRISGAELVKVKLAVVSG